MVKDVIKNNRFMGTFLLGSDDGTSSHIPPKQIRALSFNAVSTDVCQKITLCVV